MRRELLKTLGWFVYLELLFGCARGPRQEPLHIGDADVRVITDIVYPVNALWWRQSRWYDMFNDTGTPTRVVLSGQYACVQFHISVDDPRARQAFRCVEGWRAGSHDTGRRS